MIISIILCIVLSVYRPYLKRTFIIKYQNKTKYYKNGC